MSNPRCALVLAASLVSGELLVVSSEANAASPKEIDLRPGTPKSTPHSFVGLGKHAYFGATTAGGELALYRTDGTAAGTTVVKTLAGPPVGAAPPLASHIMSVVPLGGALVFSVFDAKPTPTETLWRSDGTAAGTQILSTLTVSPLGSAHYYRSTSTATRAFFLRNHSSDNTGPFEDIVQTDGTAAGTSVIAGSAGASGVRPLVTFGGHLYFSAPDLSLVRTDGVSVTPFAAKGAQNGVTGACGTDLYIDTMTGLTRTTGTFAAGTEVFTHSTAPFGLSVLACAGARAVFVSRATNEKQPRASGNTGLAETLLPPAALADVAGTIATDGTRVLFTTSDSDSSPTDLWVTDGTKPKTVHLIDGAIAPVPLGVLRLLGSVAGRTFVLSDRASATENKIFSTDGTKLDTMNLAGTPWISNAERTAVAGGVIVGSTMNEELWVFDTGLAPSVEADAGADASTGGGRGPGQSSGGSDSDPGGETSGETRTSTSGCGCHESSGRTGGFGVLAMIGLAVAVARRRRRGASSASA